MPLRLLQISDIHFGAEDRDAVRATAEFARTTPFDLLLVSGDITQLGKLEEFAAARAWLATLPGPWLATPGNHDTPWFGLLERVLAPFQRFERAIGPAAEATFSNVGLVVSCFNSARGWQIRLNWSKGEVSDRQITRTLNSLKTGEEGAVRVALCHHPLVEIPGEPITARVRGGRRAAERLASEGIDLILTGHLHVPFVKALPLADGFTYAVGAGTLSLRERGAPPGFNVIELEGGEASITAMTWKDGRLGADRTWIVPLRQRRDRAQKAVNGAAA